MEAAFLAKALKKAMPVCGNCRRLDRSPEASPIGQACRQVWLLGGRLLPVKVAHLERPLKELGVELERLARLFCAVGFGLCLGLIRGGGGIGRGFRLFRAAAAFWMGAMYFQVS